MGTFNFCKSWLFNLGHRQKTDKSTSVRLLMVLEDIDKENVHNRSILHHFFHVIRYRTVLTVAFISERSK